MSTNECKPCEALRDITCQILIKDEKKRELCKVIIDKYFLGEKTIDEVSKALNVSADAINKAVKDAIEIVKRMFKLNLKLECKIPKEVLEKMKEAINITLKTGKEAGFIVCNGQMSNVHVGSDKMLIQPICLGETNLAFHTHPESSGPSDIDIISAVSSNTKMECVGTKDKVICLDLSSVPKDVREKVRKAYIEFIKSLPNLDERTIISEYYKLLQNVNISEILKHAKKCEIKIKL